MNVLKNLNIIENNCKISYEMREQISNELESELRRFKDLSQIKLILTQTNEQQWSFDLSMKYPRGFVATMTHESSLAEAINQGLRKFETDLRTHEQQWATELFHFDNSGEYDFFTEVTNMAHKPAEKKLSVLVVEDDPAASVVLEATLKSYGCNVTHFEQPLEALESLKSNSYDLLILDWNLPYLKGGEFLNLADKQLNKQLNKVDQSNQPQRKIPVVICSTMSMTSLEIPEVSNFFVTNYWHKSLPFSSILGSVDETTKNVAS